MYAAVPRIMPARVIAGLVIVGECDTEAAAGSVSISSSTRSGPDPLQREMQ
jgi:hypothetical protein